MNFYNKRNSRLIAGMLLLTIALLFSGCATNRITSSWRNEEIQFTGLKETLVVSQINEPNARREFEDALAREIRVNGIHAVTGYSLHPNFLNHTKEALLDLVHTAKTDTVLICSIKSVESETIIQPSLDTPESYFEDDRSLPGFYELNEPVTPVVRTKIQLAINLYDVKSEKLIWKSTALLEDPTRSPATMSKVAKLVVTRMKNDGVITDR